MSSPEDGPDKPTSVFAVVVAYGPDPQRIAEVLRVAGRQVERVIVVDNGRGAGLENIEWTEALTRLDMGGNLGIASAQNTGMRHAYDRGASHVLLLDDDSMLADDTVEQLMRAWQLKSRTSQVAVVGANYQDARAPHLSPFIRLSGLRRRRVDLRGQDVVEVSYVISSGSLIGSRAFDAVGPMDEGLFIDYVDIEWGLRANQKGWKCFGAVGAKLDHTLGDAPLIIFGRRYPFHSPTRHYYMFRNGLWLIRSSSLPLSWKAAELALLFRRAIAYSVFPKRPAKHVSAIFAGIADGFRGRMGERRT